MLPRPSAAAMAIVFVLLSACSAASDTPPSISFIGIAPGTLESDVQKLQFGQEFERDVGSLVAVVAIDRPADGGKVVGTWFTPDDRNMPLGRRSIDMEGEATVARFTLANSREWDKAPYLFDVRVQVREQKNRKEPATYRETSSGSLSFFIGMNDEEIREYLEEFGEWKRREAEKRLSAGRQGAEVDAQNEADLQRE